MTSDIYIPMNLLSGKVDEVYDTLSKDALVDASGNITGGDFNTFLAYNSLDPVTILKKGWSTGGSHVGLYVRTSGKTAAVEVDYSRGLCGVTVIVDLYLKDGYSAERIWQYHDALLYYLQQFQFGIETIGFESEIHTKFEGDTANYATFTIDILAKVETDDEDEANRI